jgi:hypothetical protein
MNVTIVHSLPENKWRQFVEQSSAGNIFHSPEMFQVFAHSERHQPTLWAAVDNEQRPLTLFLPVEVSIMNGVLRRFTTRNLAYGSVLCVPGFEGQEALKTLLNVYKLEVDGNSLFTELRNLSDMSYIQQILQDQGFSFEPHLNFLIDLQRPIDEIKRSMDRNVMANVRKAYRMGVVIEEITLPDKLPAAYTVLEKVYKRIQVPLAPLSLFQSAFNILHPHQMIKFLVARVDDNYIGTAIRLLYKDVIFAWYAGALRDYSNYKAHDLLNWYIIEWGAKNGFKTFDFGGAGKPDEEYGPRAFKQKFGGNQVDYGRNTYIHAPFRMTVSRFGYTLLRKFL